LIILAKLGEYLGNPTKERSAWALESAEKIIVSNPEYRHRYDMLAGVYLGGAINGCCEPYAICLFKGSEAVKKSLSLDENNFAAHQQLGHLFAMKKKHDNAILAYKKAIELNPNSADAYSAIGWVLNLSDKPVEALEYLNKGLRLNPVSSVIWLSTFGGTYRMLGQYEKAIEMYKKCIEREPNFWGSYAGMAVAYSLSGQEKKAKTAVRQLLDLFPGYSIRYVKKTSYYKNQDRLDLIIKAYRNAGLPE
jgi:adenylate cyclase